MENSSGKCKRCVYHFFGPSAFSGKDAGIRFLLEYLGLNREGLAAFGDGDNDKELLAYARIGIAMENASPECKRAADWIAPSNDRDGVAWGIEKLLGIESFEL